MRLKLDENFGGSIASLFRTAGHHVCTVAEQRMQGASDIALARACREEERVLVSLDLDRANPMVFPPREFSGIVVLRPGVRVTASGVLETAQTLADALAGGASPDRELWVVQPRRIRVFDPEVSP